MSKLRYRGILPHIVLMLAVDASIAIAQQTGSVNAYSVTVRQGGTVIVTLSSERGIASTQFKSRSQDGEKLRGAIVTIDGRVIGLNYRTGSYTMATLDESIDHLIAERDLVLRGLDRPDLRMPPPKFAPPSLHSTKGISHIQGIAARGYILTDGGKTWRLYYAIGLPRPPATMRRRLARLYSPIPVTSHHCDRDDDDNNPDSDDYDPVASAYHIAGRALLKAELETGRGFTTVFEAAEIGRVRVPVTTFAPPVGWHLQPKRVRNSDHLPTTPQAKEEAIAPSFTATPFSPAEISERDHYAALRPIALRTRPRAQPPLMAAPAAPADTSAHVIWGPGPVIEYPEVYVYFWGAKFQDPAHTIAVYEIASSFQRIFDIRYSGFLAQYGVTPGHVIRLRFDSSNPPRFAGDGGAGAALGAFVLKEGLNGDSPLFWWTVGGHDPLYAVFVPEADVNAAIWDGMHLLVPNLVNAVVPFPFNLFVHQGMPYMLVKVPEQSLSLGFEALLYRDTCHTPGAPAVCATIPGFDPATHRASHEYVEAVTDPLPFFGWSDPSKQPVWENGEIQDICQKDPFPWGSNTRVGEVVLSTFWSNVDSACVPESRPKITIIEPSNGSAIPWRAGGATTFLNAVATDPVDGALEPIFWRVDGGPAFSSDGVTTIGSLSLGDHSLTASAVDSSNLTAEATATIHVSAKPPVATIFTPAAGATFGSGDLIVFRGYGFDYQEGLLPDSSLIWSINNQQIGTGRQFSAKILNVGEAPVMLSVTNSANESVSVVNKIQITPSQNNPSVVISTPSDQTFYRYNTDLINFSATARDFSGAVLPTSAVAWIWKSDLDGVLATNASFPHTLSGGPCGITLHHVTVTVTDSMGRNSSDTIIVYVGQIC